MKPKYQPAEDSFAKDGQIELEFEPGNPDDVTYFLDCETTGRDPSSHRIISLGVIKVRGDEKLDHWEWKFDASINDFHPKALEITGWPDEWNSKPDDRKQAYRDLNGLIRGQSLGGHNLMFDVSFLRKEFQRENLQAFELQKYCIDTAVIGNRLVQLGIVDSPSLQGLCDFFRSRLRTRTPSRKRCTTRLAGLPAFPGNDQSSDRMIWKDPGR